MNCSITKKTSIPSNPLTFNASLFWSSASPLFVPWLLVKSPLSCTLIDQPAVSTWNGQTLFDSFTSFQKKIRSCRFLSRFPEFLLFQPGSSRGHEHDYERMHLGAIERRSAEQNQQGEMLPEIGIELAPNWPELEATQMGLQEDIRKPTENFIHVRPKNAPKQDYLPVMTPPRVHQQVQSRLFSKSR